MMYVEDISREQLKLLGNILHIWWKRFYVRLWTVGPCYNLCYNVKKCMITEVALSGQFISDKK